jgi:NADH:ubiquinone oxidoreductase subunit E
MGSSCFARGNEENLKLTEDFIQEHSLDVQVEIFGLRCGNQCEKGPIVVINDIEYDGITTEELQKALRGLSSQ